MGKSTMYAVYRNVYPDRPFRYRIIDSEGKSKYFSVVSAFVTPTGHTSCFCYNRLSKIKRIEARKKFDKENDYIQVKLFTFQE